MNSQTMGFLSLKMRGDATFVACSLLFLCSSLVRAQHVIWSDEFVSGDQAIAPNPNVWTHLIGDGGGNGDLQEYTDSMENSYLQNGNLHIVIQKSVNNFGEASFTSARLESTVLVKYGTVTAKIKPPDVVEGLWPAFWTLGYDVDQVGWPRSGELNIMEIGQGKGLEEGKGNHRVVSGMHWENNGTYQASAGFWDNPVPLNDKYYAYTLDWTPTDVKTYINDVQIWRYDIDLDTCPDCEEFHKPHFLIFNQAVGGGFTTLGCGNSSGFGADCGPLRTPEEITAPIPATMFVDWVRIYDNGFTEITFPGEPELPIEPEPPCYIPEACANIDDCSHLVGECCPTTENVFLYCCGVEPEQPIDPEAPIDPGAPELCASHPACAAEGLAGFCCPNEKGQTLYCCDAVWHPVNPPTEPELPIVPVPVPEPSQELFIVPSTTPSLPVQPELPIEPEPVPTPTYEPPVEEEVLPPVFRPSSKSKGSKSKSGTFSSSREGVPASRAPKGSRCGGLATGAATVAALLAI